MPTLASTSRVQLAYILESVFNTTPVAGNGVYLRCTGESMNFDITKDQSKELRSDRQLSSVVPVGAQATGGFNFHLTYGEYDPFLQSLLQNAPVVFGTAGESGTGSTVSFTATTLTASVATSGADIWTALQLGQWFRVNAGADANNGKLLRVSTITPPTATVITLDVSTPATVSAAVAAVKLQSTRFTNGVTQTSFTIEKQMADVAQVLVFKGMTPSKMSLKIAAGALTDGTFDFLGSKSTRGVATSLPGSLVASKTYDIHNGASGVGQIWENGLPLTSTFIKTLSFDYDNNQRPQMAIGTLGLVGIGAGTINIKGTLEAYFADGAQYDRFIANAYTAITVASQDSAGNGYVITMPKVSLMSAKIVAGAKDQDLMANFEIMAVADDSNAVVALRKEIFIDRVGAALP